MAGIFNLFNSQCSEITFSYKWTIANFSRLYDEGYPWKWKICSNKFSAPNNEDFQFELHLHPKGTGKKRAQNDFVGASVCAYDIPKKLLVHAHWNVSIVDANGDKCGTMAYKQGKNYRLFCKQWKTLYFIEHKQLLNCASKYLPNDQLTLHIEIHLHEEHNEHIFNVIPNNKVNMSRFDCAKKVTTVEHTWTIKNVADLFEEQSFNVVPNRLNSKEVKPYFIQSDYFPALNQQSERFCLRLCPTGWTGESTDFVDIFLWNDNDERAIVRMKVKITEANGGEYSKEEIWNIPAKYGGHFGLHRNYLMNEVNGFVQNKKMKIYCELSYMMNSTMDNQTLIHTQIPDSIVHKSESKFDVALKTFYFVKFKFNDYCLTTNPKDASEIDSEIFDLPMDPQIQFQLCLWPPNGHDIEQSKQYLSLELCNVSQSSVTVQYRIWVLGANGQKWLRWGDQSTISADDSVKRSKFCLQSLADSLLSRLPDKKLTIMCELWVVKEIKKARKSIKHQTSKSYAQATVLNLPNANLQGAIVNMQGQLNMDNFNSNVQ